MNINNLCILCFHTNPKMISISSKMEEKERDGEVIIIKMCKKLKKTYFFLAKGYGFESSE